MSQASPGLKRHRAHVHYAVGEPQGVLQPVLSSSAPPDRRERTDGPRRLLQVWLNADAHLHRLCHPTAHRCPVVLAAGGGVHF